MTPAEVNKYIHVEIMGKCWHESRKLFFEERKPIRGLFGTIQGFEHSAYKHTCIHCGEAITPIIENLRQTGETISVTENFGFDYCSDKSRRCLLNEVVAKLCGGITGIDPIALGRLLAVYVQHPDIIWEDSELGILANAEQIARACVEAHKVSHGEKRASV